MIYQWRKGSHKGADPQAVGELIDRLAADDADGVCPTEAFVKAARPARSPAHKLIEWDDATAAEAHRRWQARDVIGSLRVIVDEESDPTVAFVHVAIKHDDGTVSIGYKSLEVVATDEKLHRQVIRDAALALRGWQRRFAHLSEFSRVIQAIEEVVDEILEVDDEEEDDETD